MSAGLSSAELISEREKAIDEFEKDVRDSASIASQFDESNPYITFQNGAFIIKTTQEVPFTIKIGNTQIHAYTIDGEERKFPSTGSGVAASVERMCKDAVLGGI